jgi:arylsulfatase
MRGQKGTPWIGGTRASSFWRWPGTLTPGDRAQLAAHIDFFPTLAGLAGAKLEGKVAAQVEGRSLLPLLENADAAWPDRTLFTHVGRWEAGADPATGKLANCAVRTPQWHLVMAGPKKTARWQLFDMKADYGEKTDVAEAHPDVVAEMTAAYEKWWESVQPQLVNEHAPVPDVNPFKALYWKQFGGGPATK